MAAKCAKCFGKVAKNRTKNIYKKKNNKFAFSFSFALLVFHLSSNSSALPTSQRGRYPVKGVPWYTHTFNHPEQLELCFNFAPSFLARLAFAASPLSPSPPPPSPSLPVPHSAALCLRFQLFARGAFSAAAAALRVRN